MTTPAIPQTPTDQLTLFIPGVPSNSNRPGQWRKFSANSERQKFRRRAAQIAETDGADWTPLDFTIITARQVQIPRYLNVRRDPTGLAERLKGPIDGLVDAGLIPDDDEKHIEVRLARCIAGEQAGIQLTLSPPKET